MDDNKKAQQKSQLKYVIENFAGNDIQKVKTRLLDSINKATTMNRIEYKLKLETDLALINEIINETKN